MYKSFLKWAGGKYKVLPMLMPIIGDCTQFIEPFAGSGCVSLNVQSPVTVVNDTNTDLINIYKTLINEGEDFINTCESLFHDGNNEEVYYQRRDEFNEIEDVRRKSALFVYLNRHCFNGLTRYNKKGKFNVPFGKYKQPYFPRGEMLQYKNLMRDKQLLFMHNLDFAQMKLYQQINHESVIYFDPPYIPINETSSFTDYHTDGFTDDDQQRVAELAKYLSKQGAKVIVSNHDVPRARELYEDARKIITLDVNRNVSASGSSRKKVKELIAIF